MEKAHERVTTHLDSRLQGELGTDVEVSPDRCPTGVVVPFSELAPIRIEMCGADLLLLVDPPDRDHEDPFAISGVLLQTELLGADPSRGWRTVTLGQERYGFVGAGDAANFAFDASIQQDHVLLGVNPRGVVVEACRGHARVTVLRPLE